MKFDRSQTIPADPVWISLPVGDFLCVYFDNRSPTYIRIMQRLTKPVRKLIDAGMLDAEKDREISIKAFVEYVVKDWRKVTSGGTEVPFTQENCVDLFTQDAQSFYALIDEATTIPNFMPSDEDRKNSATASITH